MPTAKHHHTLATSSIRRTSMVYWGDDQYKELVTLIQAGVITPYTTDGEALIQYTVTHFNGYQGSKTPASRANAIARLRKKLRNYLFDGTVKGTRIGAAQGM